MTTSDLSRWFAGILDGGKTRSAAASSPEMDARVRAAIDALPVTLFEFDANGVYTCAAGGYLSLFGITSQLLEGRSIFDFPKFVPGKNVMVRRALAGETVDLTGIWPRGRYVIRFVPRFDGSGRVSSVVALGFELAKPAGTDRHFEQLLEALRQSEARFRAMCDGAPLGICVGNPQLELGYVNPALCALLERRPEELLGRDWEDVLYPEERERIRRAREANRLEPRDRVLRLVRRDGAPVWLSLRSAAMRDEGELVGYVTVIADITQERAARLAIDAAQQDLRRVIEGSPEGIGVVRDQRWIFVNHALTQTLGLARAEALIGSDVLDMAHPDDREQALALLREPRGSAGDAGPCELRYRAASGEYVLLELRPAALCEFEGAPAILISARDITENKRLQARLAVTERLLAVGTLAAGVAHEINNPLSAALSNLEWIAEQLARLTAAPTTAGTLPSEALGRALERLVKPIEDAREACGRVRGIVQDLKLLSRAEEETSGPVELTHVIDAAVRMAWNQVRHRARLVREYGDLPSVRGNESRLAQVFLNLLINATQAIPEGRADANEIRVTARALPSQQVLVEVSDTGSGIPESVLGRIFDPFFTTKPPGIGTGLGLSICQRIVSSVGGHIEVESQVGRGSVFRVTLACAEASSAPEVLPERAAPSREATLRARVLVIDDDPQVGKALELMLTEEHDVTLFTSPRQALEQLLNGQQYDIVLCDVMMPELSGMDLHAELARSRPALADEIIFLTGGAFTLGAREFLDRIPNPHLSKPFNWAELRALIALRLTRSPG